MNSFVTKSEVVKNILNETGAQSVTLNANLPIKQEVLPVLEIGSRSCDVVATSSIASATSGTLYITPADKDFYITAAMISYVKDVTATTTNLKITISVGGATKTLLSARTTTLTIENGATSITLAYPLKIDRSTTIALTSGTNVANFTLEGSVFGYLL